MPVESMKYLGKGCESIPKLSIAVLNGSLIPSFPLWFAILWFPKYSTWLKEVYLTLAMPPLCTGVDPAAEAQGRRGTAASSEPQQMVCPHFRSLDLVT